MARTEISSQDSARSGLLATYAAPSVDGSKFINTGREVLHVKKAAGSDVTVTIETPQTVDGLAVAERTVAVVAATEQFIGPFPHSYNQSDGRVYVDWSTITGVTVAVIRLP